MFIDAAGKARSDMQLVIVESPTKAKAIQHYLGSDYKVVASKGHIRNIRKKPFGVDVENRFAVSYETEPKAEKILSDLKKLASQADSVLLATDPDREGEAIAWHLCDVLGIDPDTDCRIEYQEVTKDAVLKALQHPRKVDRNLVDAAMTRSILDYLVGFKVSPLLWKKVAKNLSAGRVQTPVLNLICERERERDTFVPEESWTVHATVNGLMTTCKEVPKDEKHAREIEDAVRDAAFTVTDISMSTRTTHPRAPFTTSTLVQAAINHLGMDVGIVMSTAQKLFEGESINGELTGLITYMRTDSVRSSDASIASLRDQIKNYYGKEYLPEKQRQYGTAANAQDAHEAIHPTDMTRTPESIRESLKEDEYKLYKLIYDRYSASQMQDAVREIMTVTFQAEGHVFSGSISKLLFPGYRKAYESTAEAAEENSKSFPAIEKGSALKPESIEIKQHFTKPEARYTQATMVRAMEENGIGRQSTYATMIRTVKDRGYVEQDGKALAPRMLGYITDDMLQKYFSIFNVAFTEEMEEKLDKISKGEAGKTKTLEEYWTKLSEELTRADQKMPKWTGEVTDRICPVCGGRLKQRLAKGGPFYGCSNFPACNYVESEDEMSPEICKTCGQHKVKKHKSNGTVYTVCINPDCPDCIQKRPGRQGKQSLPAEEVQLLEWAKKIRISKTPCTTTRLATRISQADPDKHKINSDTLNKWLRDNGYLEEKEDKYGKKRFLPTAFGEEEGILKEDRTTGKTSYEISKLAEKPQRAIVQHLKDIIGGLK